ncbi:ABC transporter permease subunit [Paenibacillus qinlingensis]|uniref:ABC-2 type transport system permease protein n=1 Tax=Paenibacillus qinlingensis TaxID=1837343 RepID=A0ABU1NWA0_9BACL|nr:ABC transporter permease subunit [Paenibacillus qinlingensis]MDR6551740.1 ABC-2 type transport system permease protein [Paenibacillus qinlingensis]
MNIFLHEVKAYRKTTLIWTLSLMLIVIFFLSLFPSISKDISEFSNILQGYPEGIRKALGIEIESFGSILGFYSYIFMYITLCGAIQAMILGTSILSKEVREKTADFLLTKPVSRTRILTAKLLAAVVLLLLTSAIYTITAIITAVQLSPDPFSGNLFIMISSTLFFVQLIFLAIGILVSVVFPRIKAVLSVSLGTVFAFFLIGMIIATNDSGAKRYLSPFKYFDTKFIIHHANYEAAYLLAATGIIFVFVLVSYLLFTRRDVHAV